MANPTKSLTRYHAKYFAHELTRRAVGGMDRLSMSLFDAAFDQIFVNGDNNLENLKAPDDTWKVRLIEEDFFRLMFETEGV
ncbi:hypothetical protein DNFV4_00363 [Nitrospira tepida]|uniref:Uncharacterized protein n=1 Tax=Nitrospira tepida TaxID=2973512 RepID=A0AA86MVT9_9BACT|nr:hypothetical protein DNFV4_00363 [Nitrospira tepida]